MKITDIKIDGFGVWHDLRLAQLSPQITIFYGANEAGKTTLLQFIRSMLYGVSPQRRQRYLPPLAGGKPGGSLGVADAENRFQLNRVADRGPEDLGHATITTDDGKAAADRLLREALADVDEPTFNNVFAIGLREIQELGTLSDTQAARWLYRLTSGVDRVSLYDVIQGLHQTRRNLLSSDQHGSKITQLVAQREALQAEIQQLAQRGRQWSQQAVRIQELDAQIAEVELQVGQCEHHARTLEIAVTLEPNWRKRAKIAARLQQFAGNIPLPDDAIRRLDELNRKIEEHQREADILQGQRQQLRDESERLGINELLVKNACRIDALGEQRDWLQSLQRQTDELEAEAQQFEQRFANEQQRLAAELGLADGDQLQAISAADLESLQPNIQEIRTIQKQVDAAQRDLDAMTESERSLQAQIESAIVAGEHHGLPMDVQEASDLVAKLRRRLQVEQRLEQARSHQQEMEQQSYELLDDQVMPLWLFGWTLAAVVLGSLMVGVWLWVPDSPLGRYGSLIALLGLGASAFSFVFKFFTEDAAAEKLDACQRQLEVLADQMEQAEQEKEELDVELPLVDGSVVLRLQAAERHLAELENVLPVEAQRKRAGHEVATAETRMAQARGLLDKALAAWQSKLAGLGFSEKLDPLRFLAVTDRLEAIGDLEIRAQRRREEVDQRRREHAMLVRRIDDLAEEVGCLLDAEQDAQPLDQLDHLLSERRRQLADVERREEFLQRAKQLKAEEARHRRAVVGLQRRREAQFQAADCADEQAYRQLADEQAQAAELRKRRKSITREIAAAIGPHAPEETFAELLSPANIGQLESLRKTAQAELQAQQSALKTHVDQRGALRQQQRALAEDRSLAERQLDFSCVEKQLADARQRWREHATVSRVLERIRADYEAHRQPETLGEASRYLSQLTGGAYTRVWTPLANDILLVENSASESLPVEVLSRGTREQLFLSVRLALVATFARRGVRLPMVLDDVLVNFDAVRARQAAEVLREFAAGGHQLLVFTCHEHMWQMFQDLEVDCRRLPNRRGETWPEPKPVKTTAEMAAETIPEEEAEIAPAEPAPQPHSPVEPEEPFEVKAAPRRADFYDYPFVEKIEQEVQPRKQAGRQKAEVAFYRDHLEPRRA